MTDVAPKKWKVFGQYGGTVVWSLVCFLAGFLLAVSLYDPWLLRLRATTPHPLPVPDPEPGTIVVGPLSKDWDFDSDAIAWEPVLPLAQISDAAYRSGTELDTTLSKWGLSKVQEFSHDSMYACVASNEDVVVVAFRGTNSDELADWLADANIRRDRVPEGYIHQGFFRSTNALLPDLRRAVNEQGGERKKIWVTGHSLGGAMALVFTYDCIERGDIKPVGLVTFGQPLVVSGQLAGYLNQQLKGKYVRFIHGGDAVTRVFPTFSHCGNLIWLKDGSYEFRRPEVLRMAMEANSEQPPLAYGENVAPMSKQEFADFQDELKHESKRSVRPFKRSRDLHAAGAPAALQDHYMSGYLHWIVVLSEKAKAADKTNPATAK